MFNYIPIELYNCLNIIVIYWICFVFDFLIVKYFLTLLTIFPYFNQIGKVIKIVLKDIMADTKGQLVDLVDLDRSSPRPDNDPKTLGRTSKRKFDFNTEEAPKRKFYGIVLKPQWTLLLPANEGFFGDWGSLGFMYFVFYSRFFRSWLQECVSSGTARNAKNVYLQIK